MQLIEFPYGDGIEVAFAGGRRELMGKNQTDPEYPDKKGERLDGRDLIQEWVNKHPNSEYVWNKTQFDNIDVEKVDHVLGTYIETCFFPRSSPIVRRSGDARFPGQEHVKARELRASEGSIR